MSETSLAYLHSLAHALSNMQLYGEGHPARSQVVDRSFGMLETLLEADSAPRFSFIDGSVIYSDRPLHELYRWSWALRLPSLGVKRLEFDPDVSREAYAQFLGDVVGRLVRGDESGAQLPQRKGIRCGDLRVTGEEAAPAADGAPPVAALPYRLGEEADAVRWLYQQATTSATLPMSEVEAVVRSLMVAMHSDGELAIPLLEFHDSDQYSALHAINVSILAMTMAESLGMSSRDIRGFGIAGLLHDIGMTQIPTELIHKAEDLTPEEWEVLRLHPVAGAKMLLQKSGEHEIAAVAAYEHHSRPDGSGYPQLKFPRDHHYVSKVIAVCDAYDALRAPKAYRDAHSPAEALEQIEMAAGSQFDHGVAMSFTSLMRRMGAQIQLLPQPSAPALAGKVEVQVPASTQKNA